MHTQGCFSWASSRLHILMDVSSDAEAMTSGFWGDVARSFIPCAVSLAPRCSAHRVIATYAAVSSECLQTWSTASQSLLSPLSVQRAYLDQLALIHVVDLDVGVVAGDAEPCLVGDGVSGPAAGAVCVVLSKG